MQEKNKQLSTQWLSYAMFYLCRVNFAIVAPILMALMGYTIMDIGLISSGLLVAYAIGQFVNGQINDRYSKTIKTVGMFGSAVINISMAFVYTPLVMAVLWIMNGYFQSMGWSASVKMVANWFPEKERGKASGILGTSYQIGNVFAWLLAGYAVVFGYRLGFIIPAVVFMFGGIQFALMAKQSPEDAGMESIEGLNEGETYVGLKCTLKTALFKWTVWISAISLLLLNIVRYGFLTWSPTMLYQLDPNITSAALKAMIFPLSGSIGALTIGFAEKKIKNTTRLAALFLFVLADLIILYPMLTVYYQALVCLALIGFMTYAPHVLIVTRIPMLLGTRKTCASITGFIDGFGYIGATMTGIVTAILTTNYGWHTSLNFWALGAVGSALSLTLLCNYKRGKQKYE